MPLLPILVGIAILCLGRDSFGEQWLLGQQLTAVCLVLYLSKLYRPALLGIGGYMAAQTMYPPLFYSGIKQGVSLAAVGLGLQYCINIAVFSAFLGVIRIPFDRVARYFIGIGSVATVLGYPPLYNTSLNAAFMACLLPVAADNRLVIPVLLVAILQRGASAAIVLGLYFLVRVAHPAKWLAVAAGLVMGIRSGYLLDSDRVVIYTKYFDFWRHNLDIWFGSGFGSFVVLGPYIQKIVGYQDEGRYLLSLHSDWLQLLFEGGIVGLALGLWLFVSTLYFLPKPERESLFYLGVIAIWYFPAQVPLILIYALGLVLRAQRR